MNPVDIDTEPSYSFGAELDDELIRNSAIFTTVHWGARRTSEPVDKLITLMKKVCYQLSPFSHVNKYGETSVRTKFRLCLKNGNQVATSENKQIRILLERQKEQILAEIRSEIHRSTNFQAESDRRSIQELTGIIEILSEWQSIILLQEVSNPGEINYYFKKKYQNKIGIFVKLVSWICETWKNCRKVTC